MACLSHCEICRGIVCDNRVCHTCAKVTVLMVLDGKRPSVEMVRREVEEMRKKEQDSVKKTTNKVFPWQIEQIK